MKIGIDARVFSQENPVFFLDFVQALNTLKNDHTFIIYTPKPLPPLKPNIIRRRIDYGHNYFKEQILFLKELFADHLDVLITFEETRPLLYKKKVVQVLSTLEKLLYPNREDHQLWNRMTHLSTMKTNVKQANLIVCYDKNIKTEINEKLNIPEQRIFPIQAFFPSITPVDSNIDIKSKHGIQWEYIIYDAGVGNNKNMERFLQAFAKVSKKRELYLVCLGKKISEDIETRQLTLDMKLSNKVVFVWVPNQNELKAYYTQSIGVVHPSLYDVFPFTLNIALRFGTPILITESEQNHGIFGDEVSYFSPTSLDDMSHKLEIFTQNTLRTQSYDSILETYHVTEFCKNLTQVVSELI